MTRGSACRMSVTHKHNKSLIVTTSSLRRVGVPEGAMVAPRTVREKVLVLIHEDPAARRWSAPAPSPARGVDEPSELRGFDDRAAAPRRHRGQVYVTGDDHKRAHGQGEVKDTVVLPVGAVSYGLRWIDQTAAGGIGHLNEDRDVLIDLVLGSSNDVPEHPPGIVRMCGDSQSPNSAASLITPRQSASGFRDVGGGDGQLR